MKDDAPQTPPNVPHKGTHIVQRKMSKPVNGAQTKKKGCCKKHGKSLALAIILLIIIVLLAICFALLLTRTKDTCNCREIQAQIEAARVEVDETKTLIMEITGWFPAGNGYWYKMFLQKVDYKTARQRCKALKADLAAVGMRNKTVKQEIKKNIPSVAAWIGLTDLQKERVWKWSDNVLAKDADWNKGEPSHTGINLERCARVRPNGRFNNIQCNYPSEFLCEKKVP